MFEGRAQMVVVPGAEGELGVLPRHAPIIARLKVGEVRVKFEATSGAVRHQRRLLHGEHHPSTSRAALVLVEDAVAATTSIWRRRRRPWTTRRRGLAEAEGGDQKVDRFRAERDLLTPRTASASRRRPRRRGPRRPAGETRATKIPPEDPGRILSDDGNPDRR